MKQQKKQASITLFYSYASVDRQWRDQLAIHLSQLKRDGLIEELYDQQILAGKEHSLERDRMLRSAQIILLLISADFLASDACYQEEMQQALERHQTGVAHIIPIIVRPCDWQYSPFAHLQCLPRNSKPITAWDDQDEACVAIVQELRRIIAQRQFPIPSLSSTQRQNRERLLKRVRATWIKELLEHSLHRAIWIDLHLQEQPDALENPWRLQMQELDHAPRPLPVGTSIIEVYDEADGELLILGEPGAGKTTLLLELTRTLLERAEKDEQLPLPMVFNLSSWAEKRQPLGLWLVEELRTKYQVPRQVGQDWIDANQVLPLLDGLDEVAKDARSACVEQINDYYHSRLEGGGSPIVICCRHEEYAALSTRVELQHAVSILPLTDEQINTYLEQAGEQAKGLWETLNEDTELYELARQPLMLNIFTLAYQGAQASEIPTGATREEMRHTIFAKYVERMIKRRSQSKHWKPEQVIRWLTFLAKQMHQHNQAVFSVEDLQPTWLPRGWRILYLWSVKLPGRLIGGLTLALGGLTLALFFGLVFVQFFGHVVYSVFVLGFELLVFVLSGLVFALFFRPATRINPAEALIWSWKKARSGLVLGLVFGLAVGLVLGLFSGLLSGLLNGLAVGLVLGLFFGPGSGLLVGLFFGLVLGLVRGLSGKQLPERLSLSPNEGIWRSGKNGLFFGLGGGLLIGLLLELVLRLFFGLAVGLVVGLFFGLFFGLGAFAEHFLLRFFLLWRGDLPWDFIAFLDEAAGRLLLRKVGGSYIFVHRLLLDYFTTLGEPVSTESNSPVSKV